MRVLKSQALVLIPESDLDREALDSWHADHAGQVFALPAHRDDGTILRSLGPRDHACREPVAISSLSPDPQWRLIGNFAPTPFELDGRPYANVEAFWQGLKFPGDARRRAIAAMTGPQAKKAGEGQGYGPWIDYEGRRIVPGTWDHWKLMERACTAKFRQNPEAAAALLATGDRPLAHPMRRDSRTIPGVILAEIWTRLRARLAEGSL
jgi:predicted NAD-dependent protein-ADP-ribosyltransferase YbiA (DUF1768 family)